MIDFKVIKETDPQVCEALELELARQQGNIELIASENIVTPAVMAAAGSHLTNKYAEGYSGKRILRRLRTRRYSRKFGD